MSVDLKPCPFCGGKAKIETHMDECLWSHNQVEWTTISCDDTWCEMEPSISYPSEIINEVIDHWNKRPPEKKG